MSAAATPNTHGYQSSSDVINGGLILKGEMSGGRGQEGKDCDVFSEGVSSCDDVMDEGSVTSHRATTYTGKF